MKEYSVIISIVLIFSLCAYFFINKVSDNVAVTVDAVSQISDEVTVILDAGHGGEDGGAVAYDGTEEKDINLEITSKIAALFDIFDINYVEIRNSDCSVGDLSLDTVKERKTSDIKKRFEIVNSTENSLLLSIHQNMYSVEKYSGLQVFYAPGCTESELLADSIQNTVKTALQPENTRKIKQSDKSIFLLYNAENPSVLVECGFMSNFEELNKLKTEEYQCKLAYFITSGLIKYLTVSKEY